MAGACLRTGRRPRAGFFASGAGLIETFHRLVEASERPVEVRAGLLKRRVSEHLLHVVHGTLTTRVPVDEGIIPLSHVLPSAASSVSPTVEIERKD